MLLGTFDKPWPLRSSLWFLCVLITLRMLFVVLKYLLSFFFLIQGIILSYQEKIDLKNNKKK